jgi:hypothetical protein
VLTLPTRLTSIASGGTAVTTLVDTRQFFGWRVVGAVFVLAMFGWGVGFYGPPIYLHAVQQERGWSLALVSTAVTIHFLFGALVIATLPRLYRRFGVATVTKFGSVALAIGVIGWASAKEPWQLIAATLLSGGGWVTMGAAAVNAIIAPWFVRQRPAALSFAYNGASIGGVVFSPLWVAAIGSLGFALASALIGLVMIVTIWILTNLYYAREPEKMGLSADGAAPAFAAIAVTTPSTRPLPGSDLWRDLRFITLAAAMALGLFAQIGLLTHLFSLLVTPLGTQLAGIATGAATAAAIAGRTFVGWLMPAGADRRLFGCASYLVQMLGSLALLFAAGDNIPLLALGVVLFGAGIGNATSLPPLIAQAEFVRDDVARAVPMIVAIAQASYAFAPAVFGLIRASGPAIGSIQASAAPCVFITAALMQCLAIGALLVGRRR